MLGPGSEAAHRQLRGEVGADLHINKGSRTRCIRGFAYVALHTWLRVQQETLYADRIMKLSDRISRSVDKLSDYFKTSDCVCCCCCCCCCGGGGGGGGAFCRRKEINNLFLRFEFSSHVDALLNSFVTCVL